MTNQSELEVLRCRLVAVLRDRLSEAEDDEARQAAWEATNWELAAGTPCSRCHKPSLRLIGGVCLPCIGDLAERADRKARSQQRFLRLMKAHNARVDKRKRRGPASAGPPQQPSGHIEG